MIAKPLREIGDARSFLAEALALRYGGREKINLSDFSRRAGFSSRSYLSELLTGKKGFSRDSVSKIKSALKLPRGGLELFELLVLLECPPLRARAQTVEAIDSRIRALRERLRESEDSGSQQIKRRLSRAFGKPQLFQVYAALGTKEGGATLAQIEKRTGLKIEVILPVLDRLESLEAIRSAPNRFYPLQATMDVFGLGETPELERLIQEAAGLLQSRTRDVLRDPASLVFFTSFSIESRRLPQFRDDLRAAVFEVLDRYQDDEGDLVRNVLLGSFS